MSIHDYLVDEKYICDGGAWYVGKNRYIPNDDIDGAIKDAIMEERDISDNIRSLDFKIIEEPVETYEWNKALVDAMFKTSRGCRRDPDSMFRGLWYIVETKFGDYGPSIQGSHRDDVLNNGVIGKFVASFISSEDN